MMPSRSLRFISWFVATFQYHNLLNRTVNMSYAIDSSDTSHGEASYTQFRTRDLCFLVTGRLQMLTWHSRVAGRPGLQLSGWHFLFQPFPYRFGGANRVLKRCLVHLIGRALLRVQQCPW